MTKLFLLALCTTLSFPSQDEVERQVLRRYDNGNPYVVFYVHIASMTKVKEELYYEDGNLDYVGHFKDGMEHGDWIYYWPNGNIKSYEYYENGLEEGIHFDSDENGKRLKDTRWEKGTLMGSTDY